LRDEQRGKAAVAVARYLDTDRAILGHDGLGSFAITLVGGLGRLGRPRKIAQVVIELSAQRTFDQCLLKRQRRGVDRFGRHRAIAERLQHASRNAWQLGRRSLGFAWHTTSFTGCYALNTKFLTGPGRPQLLLRRRLNATLEIERCAPP